MFEFHAAVRKISDGLRMSHDKNGVPRVMQLAQKFQDYRFVRLVQISGRFVRENYFRLIDQRASDGDALLLAAR